MKLAAPLFHRVVVAGIIATALSGLAGCAVAIPGDAAPIVKIGLVAPFEGLCRSQGYTLLPIVREKLETANREARFGAYRVALVAANDDCDQDEGLQRVEELALDPDVMAVLGVWDAAAQSAVDTASVASWPPVLGAAPAYATTESPTLCAGVEEMASIIWAKAAETTFSGGPPAALLITADPLGEALAKSAPLNTPIISADTTPEPGQAVVSASRADDAAELIVLWRSYGWSGHVIGGPDLAKTWLVDRTGQAGEGSLALVCGEVPDGEEPAAVLAAKGTERILSALEADIDQHGKPTRNGVAQFLGSEPDPVSFTWKALSGGSWVSIR